MSDALPHVRRLTWTTDGDPRVCMRMMRHVQAGPRPRPLHDHTFYEFFLIEEGRGRHSVNGQVWDLEAGDLVFIRPADVHGFTAVDDAGWSWTNVTLRAPTVAAVQRRFGRDLGLWPWRDGPMPVRLRLGEDQVAAMLRLFAAMPVDIHRRVDLDWAMATVLRLIQYGPSRKAQSPPPTWLDGALRQLREAGPLDPQRLVRLAGRSREHVNRTVRQHLGMTSNELVHRLRLDRAARDLRLTDREIIDIAEDAGYTNLSYFYRRFRRQFGLTPRQFRLQAYRRAHQM